MSIVLALALALQPLLSVVQGVRVAAVNGRTEVAIQVDGEAFATHFMLNEPARIVIDLAGARYSLPQDRYPGIDRGGVAAIRISQQTHETVRIVVDLSAPVEYTLARERNLVRLSFANDQGAFETWTAGVFREVELGTGDRSTVPERAGSPPLQAAANAAGNQPYRRDVTRVTVSFRDMPLLDVLATFAEFAGRSIVPGSDLNGTVNATIVDQPWDVALESILLAHGLAVKETEHGIIRVDRLDRIREREQLEDLVTVPFTIRYTPVDSIAPAIEGLVSSRGGVTRNRNSNTLIVTDGRSVVESRIAPMIQQLDVQQPQVTIAAKIIFVDRSALQELGVVYDLKDSRGNQLNSLVTGRADLDGRGVLQSTSTNVVSLGGNSIAGLANATLRVAQPQLQIVTSLVLNRHSLINFIEALSQTTLSEVQASPTVTVLANREALVQVGERTPIRVIDAGTATAGDGSQAPRATVSIQETGIILRVTPHVVGEQVLLDLRAENSRVALAPSDIGLTFSTQLSQTQVIVNNGETTVIGGLTVVERSNVRTGIPILMNLPVLGALFRTTRDQEVKRDLLIMVTPHIIREAP
jgi:type IV pilus assembly protein PilQ